MSLSVKTGSHRRCAAMSALGHKQTCAPQKVMSPLHPKADMCDATSDVRYGPIADIQSRGCASGRNHEIFAQRTPNQISERKMVSTDMPVEITTAGDTVLKYTLYC